VRGGSGGRAGPAGRRNPAGSDGNGRNGRGGGGGGGDDDGGSGRRFALWRRSEDGRRDKRTWPQRLIIGAGVVVVTVCLLGLGAVAYVLKSLGDIDRYDDLGVDAAAAGEPRNYLVVGSDSRVDAAEYGDVSGQRSDTIMVVRLDPKTMHADVLSIPRDLLVTISGTGETARINSAYSTSRQVLIDTLRDNFNIEINHYIEVDFSGFQQLVDAVGGVPLYLDRAVKDDHSGLFVSKLGCVTLDGEQALAFARARHLRVMQPDGEWSREDPYADLGRIQRQQVFMRRAVVRAIGAAKSNPLKLRELVDIGVSNVGIDGQTDPISLANEFKDFDPADLTTYSIPVLDSGDGATVVPDRREANPVLNVFRGLDPGEMSPDLIDVTVLNGSGAQGQANDAAAAFQTIGFTIGEPSDIEPHERTTVYHLPGEQNLALQVSRYITGGADLKVREDLGLEAGEVVVATGQDFTTVHRQPTPLDKLPDRGPDSGVTTTTTTTTAAGGVGAGSAGGGGGTTPTTRPSPTTTAPSEYTIGDPPPGIRCG
jgi:LCP family protein required for cell wall assembly